MPSYSHQQEPEHKAASENPYQASSSSKSQESSSQLLSDLGKMKVEDVSQLEDLGTDPKLAAFSVTKPVKVAGHIRYTVTGVDSDGPFEESRRYKEFYALRQTLAQRWPGIYIPAIPEKKLVGNNDDAFLEERRHLLERFMKECGRLDYVTHSKEFKIFARDKGDIEKILANQGRVTPMQILERYRLNFNIDED